MSCSSGRIDDFAKVHENERRQLGLSRNLNSIDGVGLALSGGGIRSASFALGVVQVLLNENLLRKVDYLSTVSGGGYLGSAISWWLHQAATDSTATKDIETPYEAFRQQFGSKVIGARTTLSTCGTSNWSGSNWLAYIRQHGNYLQPRGVGYASLLASILRVCLYPVCVYGITLTGLFALIRAREVSGGVTSGLEIASLISAGVALIFLILLSWIYGPATLVASYWSGKAAWIYRQRTQFRMYSGKLLSFVVAFLVLATVPIFYDVLGGQIATWISSVSSLSLGSIGTAYQFIQGRAQKRSPSWLGSARLIATAGLVIYGLLLGSYATAQLLSHPMRDGLGALGFAFVFGLCINTNYAGLARLYRDRLMEAFLPEIACVADNKWGLATGANEQTVADLKGRLNGDGRLRRTSVDQCQRPLQLINCNTVLLDSSSDLYRNRGGDSFCISPIWSGSNATGWIPTSQLGDGAVSLATAMSISGAAANPNAAPNGLGITRNRLVSFLMSLFNVRLGYWMANPKRADGKTPSNKPNLWYPGLLQGLLGSGLHERANFLELTDGGHFDNTALYELVRRRTKVIVVAQAGCDPAFTMEDLANAIEKVRVDFSVFIEFNDEEWNLDGLRVVSKQPFTPCSRGFAIGRIRYPIRTLSGPEYDDGYLVYLQAVPSRLPADINSYWRRHDEFPNDTTADQFFTEQNLEAYRELGYAIASDFHKTIKDNSRSSVLVDIKELLLGIKSSDVDRAACLNELASAIEKVEQRRGRSMFTLGMRLLAFFLRRRKP